MILADTSVWIDYFRGVASRETDLLNSLLDEERIATGDLIIAELMQGFITKNQISTALQIINHLEYFDLAGKEIALKAADNYRVLRKKGVTIRKTIDTIIGTFCIEKGFKLLHNDRDFDPMEQHLGLLVV
jgi:predicted nucleic acid-binding protein